MRVGSGLSGHGSTVGTWSTETNSSASRRCRRARSNAACAGENISALITHCYDEYLDLRERAEDTRDADELRAFYLQEASAWRDTARVLRAMNTDQKARAVGESGAA
ncbi:hypothetical protein [Gordonia sp. (in: high G+C Gram-positive bacteria)]|uniref:hypothetical protein n=1 Tax=Gordonia sp. (in: high G+C Gram-positive bacteria) TaxID=84139 RepID=UPI0039E4F419